MAWSAASFAGGDDALNRIRLGDCRGAGDEINDGLARKEARAYLLAGYLYDATGCVAHDAGRAESFYRKAMDLGDIEAKNFLGVMYGLGNGVPQDYRKAYQIFTDERIKDPEFARVRPDNEVAAGFAYTVTQLARAKAIYPDHASPGTVTAQFDVATTSVSFPRSSGYGLGPLRNAVVAAYEAAVRDAPPLAPDASHDFQVLVPWTFQLQ